MAITPKQKQTVLRWSLHIAIVALLSTVIGLIFGWESTILVVAIYAGTSWGATIGGREATKVEEYRSQWLARRAASRRDVKLCPACNHDWSEHLPEGNARSMCSECVFEMDHEEPGAPDRPCTREAPRRESA